MKIIAIIDPFETSASFLRPINTLTTNYRQYFSFSCDVKFKCNFVIATTLSSQKKLPWLKKINNCCNLMDNALFHLHVHSDTYHKSPIMFCKLNQSILNAFIFDDEQTNALQNISLQKQYD